MFPLNGRWHKVKDRNLSAWCEKEQWPESDIDELIYLGQVNPLSMFLPHGRPRTDAQVNDGRAFINDWTHDLTMLLAGSKQGKSYAGAAKAGFWAGPCNPSWFCFTQHGVEYRKWQGPSEGILSSFSWDNVAILWETYRKLWPREWLGPYAPNWGMFPGETGRGKSVTFGDGKHKTIPLPCGVTLTMLCDTQSMVHWESRWADWAHLDEQLSEGKMDILVSRFQTSAYDQNPIWTTLTPFVVDGRPDTGAHGWLFAKQENGQVKGLSLGEYRITMESIPNEIVNEDKKKKAYRLYVEQPELQHDEKRIRSGRARYYAEPEVGGGIILSAWNPDIHMIEPFDLKAHHPTYYRYIDHGENPCAGLLVALMPWGDHICFSEYYEFGHGLSENARRIVEDWCKNARAKISLWEYDGQTWPVYEEQYVGLEFYASEMDARSFGSNAKESGRTLGQVYNDNGCWVTPASAAHNERQDRSGTVDLLGDFFELDPHRTHINARIGRPVPELARQFGAPRLYVFNTLHNFKAEIEGWIRNPKTGKPIDRDDHLMSCAKFHAARPRYYMGNTLDRDTTDARSDEQSGDWHPQSRETGY